jgi:RNA polymerase subunit RPABC4/transcription elongation factor Spt4
MIKCPKCNSQKVIVNFFGLPNASEEDMAKWVEGYYKVEFEGCVVFGDEDDRVCEECKYHWQSDED